MVICKRSFIFDAIGYQTYRHTNYRFQYVVFQLG